MLAPTVFAAVFLALASVVLVKRVLPARRPLRAKLLPLLRRAR